MPQSCPDCGGPLATMKPRTNTPDAEYDPKVDEDGKDIVAEDRSPEEGRSDRIGALVCTNCGEVVERPTA